MKKLLGWYGALPKEAKMMIAMAGLGTPIGIIWFIQRYLFPRTPLWMVILIVAAVGAAIAGLIWLITKLFGRGGRKRSQKMEAALASTAEAGPVSMDLRASIKSNNEKFFAAIRDMRKLGISVYDLPWYIVLGDSGCGKTKLINEGGLTFSTGKPEGYQLGTLNYNWWFTEDAIFVDMAGRLCNPQDDADHREWEAFLRSVATGRKGYPINGALACISAEHLLQDPAEKHEADANTMLERLRDLQSKLGVTFATYLVVTKCDKIVGFMQFFDRAERDITIKNQIFGWSRPGEFSELYDPERFGSDFDGVYTRLNELRLRRLNDDVDEFELGMAYSFPEEYRQLREPLQTYIRTLFPGIRNPRAVKNLIFRGVYFTSATQQGGLILRHLTERLGSDAAAQFQPLESLYPRPRPHFVKDLLFRKAFPEHGLVFRNEQEVVRNRKLARMLTIGSGAVGALLLVLLIVSSVQFGKLIANPRQRATDAPAMAQKPEEALTLVGALGRDADVLKSSIWPDVLSLGFGSDRPARDLSRISLELFECAVLRGTLKSVEGSLATTRIAPSDEPGARAVAAGASSPVAAVPFDRYRAALEEYLAWYGCANHEGAPERIDQASFEKLGAIVPADTPPFSARRAEVLEQAKRYFITVRSGSDARNPARVLTTPGFRPPQTIRAAVTNLHQYGQRFTSMSEENPDPVIREWMRIRDCCAQIHDAYAAMLTAGEGTVETQEQLDGFRQSFEDNYAKLTKAMDECTWRLKSTGPFVRIPSLRDALRKHRQAWLDYLKSLRDAYTRCGARDAATDPVQLTLTALLAGDKELPGLDRVLADSLQKAGLAERGYYADFFGETFDKLVHEVFDPEAFGYAVALVSGGDTKDDQLVLSDQLRGTVRPVLDKVHERLATLGTGAGGDTPQAWVASLQTLLFPSKEEKAAAAADFAALPAAWERKRLERLNATYQDLIRKGAGTALLHTIESRLQQTGPLGIAELLPDWRTTVRSAYYIPVPTGPETAPAPKEGVSPPVVKETGGPPPVVSQAKPPGPAAPVTPAGPPKAAERVTGTGQIPGFASTDFLRDRALECVQLLRFLNDFGPAFYFARANETTPLNRQCAALVEGSWKRYCEGYVQARGTAYKDKKLSELERVARWNEHWEPFAAQFQPGRSADTDVRSVIRDEFQPALSEVLRATRWALWLPERGASLADDQDEYYGTQKRQVAGIFEAALQGQWTQGAFARSAAAGRAGPAANPKPWESVAGDYAERWMAWCAGAGGAAKLPRKFTTDESAAKLSPIPWADIATLRNETGLGDEHITQQLVDFQQKAQALLSAELTDILCGVQTDAFSDQAPYGGWPYVNAGGQGTTALDTVKFEQFTQFLLAVQRAEAALGPLDQGLPDETLHQGRRVFYQSCAQWRSFLGLSPQGAPRPLDLAVWIEDPLGEPFGKDRVDDTAQHFYMKVRLCIGLRQQAGDTASPRPLEFQTTDRGSARSVKTVWDWARPAELQELTFELVDGIQPERRDFHYPPIKPKVLGAPSPLALCAYLHRYGRYVDGNWVVSHGVDLAEKLREGGHSELVSQLPGGKTIFGEKFIFRLPADRNLPEPILKLVPGGAPTAQR